MIITALLGVLGAVWVQRYVARRAARQAFRERVIEYLAGFYPPPGEWRIGFEPKLANAVERLEREAAKFRFHVPKLKRGSFDLAWSAFREHARAMDWNSCAAFVLYPTMRPQSAKDPKTEFYERLDRLLAHAEET